MRPARVPFVHEADLQLEPATRLETVGAAVTTALCGQSDHEGPCRWPHNNAIDAAASGSASFRTLFVAPPGDEREIRNRIESSLRAGQGWSVLDTRARPLAPGEQPLARRLATTPSSAEA
jgi:hypothetical protein